jgi:hypothetical protein
MYFIIQHTEYKLSFTIQGCMKYFSIVDLDVREQTHMTLVMILVAFDTEFPLKGSL